MIIKQLKITNASGDSIEFGRHFKLYKEIDLSGLSASINYADSSNDGANYQTTNLDTRDIEIPFFIDRLVDGYEWFEEKRQEAFRVCNAKKNPMRIDLVTQAGAEYYLKAELSAQPTFATGFEESNYRFQKGLLQFTSADPYLYEKNQSVVQIATWVPSFGFELDITSPQGIEMGYRSPSLIANVLNEGQDRTGMIIKFKALGSMSTPTLVNINTYESFKLNLDLLPGDVVEVSTYSGRKYARLTRNNVVTSVFGRIDLTSTFLQLETGDNLFRYDALTGIDNLEVSMYFSNKFVGV